MAVNVSAHNRGGAKLVALATVALAVSLAPPAAAADPDRSAYVPDGLTSTVTTAHFVLRYNPATPSPVSGMTIDAYAQAGASDFEEAYGHLVTGGGSDPNAGLRQPTDDGDGKTDVYLAAPKDRPTFQGGTVYRDPSLGSAYMFMTPTMARTGFRFRTAHEFMHVIQNAYTPGVGDGLGEGFANWAAEWALADIDPLDNNFYSEYDGDAPHPWLPLDCSYGSWDGTGCGNGYWQWLFVQAQVEDYGPDFATGYLDRFAATYADSVSFLLDQEINAQSGGADSLSARFAAYARDVWDPTRWTTNSIRRIRDEMGLTPASYFYGVADFDTGWQQVSIDHLAARYVEVQNYTVYADPGDQVELSWQRPGGMAASVRPIAKPVGQEGWSDAGSFDGTEGTATLGFGPDVERVVLPLVNDSLTADDQPFAYRVRQIAAPEPPQTRIRKHPPKRTSKRRATFTFGAPGSDNTYACKLDRKKFKPCKSPKKVKVKPGKHVFQVAATDATGSADPTPAKWKWTVTRRQPR